MKHSKQTKNSSHKTLFQCAVKSPITIIQPRNFAKTQHNLKNKNPSKCKALEQ